MENIRDTDPPDRPSNLANTSGLSQDTPPPPLVPSTIRTVSIPRNVGESRPPSRKSGVTRGGKREGELAQGRMRKRRRRLPNGRAAKALCRQPLSAGGLVFAV